MLKWPGAIREHYFHIHIGESCAGKNSGKRFFLSFFPSFLRGRLKQQRTDWLRAFPPQHPTQSGSGEYDFRDSVTNRFNGVPLLGPNSMMEYKLKMTDQDKTWMSPKRQSIKKASCSNIGILLITVFPQLSKVLWPMDMDSFLNKGIKHEPSPTALAYRARRKKPPTDFAFSQSD